MNCTAKQRRAAWILLVGFLLAVWFIDILRGRSPPRLYRGRLRRLRTAETLREYPALRKRWFRAVHSNTRAAFCVGGLAVALLSAFADKNTDSTKGKTVGLRNACPYDS